MSTVLFGTVRDRTNGITFRMRRAQSTLEMADCKFGKRPLCDCADVAVCAEHRRHCTHQPPSLRVYLPQNIKKRKIHFIPQNADAHRHRRDDGIRPCIDCESIVQFQHRPNGNVARGKEISSHHSSGIVGTPHMHARSMPNCWFAAVINLNSSP